MPNWCSNTLSVSAYEEGSMNEFYDFLERIKGLDEEGNTSDFSFHSLVPRPKDEEDWYHWNIANWGTKWDVSEVSVSVEEEYAYFNFQTAWSPPEVWVRKIAPMFPNLTLQLTYHEGGMGFAGKLVMEGEEIFEDFSVGTEDELYWDLATEGMTDEEIEDNAMERIEQSALDHWTYTFDDLIKYVGERHREKIEQLIIVQKLTGKMEHSTQTEYVGREIEEVIESLIDTETFFQNIFNEKKEKNELKKLAA